MKQIVLITYMDKMPNSCLECALSQSGCNKAITAKDTIKKAYLKKRHPDCRLKEIEE